RDALVELNLLSFQRMQYARAADSFRCRPDQHDRVGCPRFRTTRVAESAVKINNWFSILPNRNRCAEFATFAEVFAKEWFKSCAKFFGIEAHWQEVGHASRLPNLRCK